MQAGITHIHRETPVNSVLRADVNLDGKRVLYFRVSKSTSHVHLTSDGRCLRRNDLESAPASADKIQFDRREITSREYDRGFIDGASPSDLDAELLRMVADQISSGMSTDKCLQYLGLAEYDSNTGLQLRRGALLLFATEPGKWHPRTQVRIIRVKGAELGAGASYNVISDETILDNVVRLIDEGWEALRPHLVETRFHEDARFRAAYKFPEQACREALVNAIAHRDYSEEGIGIEVYIFDDRIEFKNPGALLSSITIEDISNMKGAHQSRNSYIARDLPPF